MTNPDNIVFASAPRAVRAADRLASYRKAAPESRHQARDAWLELATPGEVRKNWRKWMGVMPGWAK